jgi:hypothetical protein
MFLWITHQPNWQIHKDPGILNMVDIQDASSQTSRLMSQTPSFQFRPSLFPTRRLRHGRVKHQLSSIKCQTSNLKSRNHIFSPVEGLASVPAPWSGNRERPRREFFDFSTTGFHLVPWLQSIAIIPKPYSPLHLRSVVLPRSWRGPTM